MIIEAICRLTNRADLTFSETKAVFEEIFGHKATPSQIAAFLVALKMKGEKEEEIFAAATVVRQHAKKLKGRQDFMGIEDSREPIFDTCGTGGSGINKFNISTAVAFVVSAAGIKVAKHGNRAMSSSCGSADVLEALGIRIDSATSVMEEALKVVGISFLYAPLYHPALAEVAKVRREMATRTIFNILGPLCNPALANYQLLGVYKRELLTVISRVLKKLGVRKAFVVHGKDLKDEVSLTGPTYVAFLNNKRIEKFVVRPSDFGLKKISLGDLEVKDANMSAKVIKDILDGKKGAPRDIVLANASCCFYILGKAKNFKQGVKLAARLVDEGKAADKLLEFRKFLSR
ncbi:MAG: anthranilate phosphoribosyltransferase [Candidatus Omnitrophota bacterium]|nr:MAG: anthranilate phosphoribosyltransferase [Candidatus Omnitrophota bacterium]